MGLPGSGKTTFAKELIKYIDAKWINADEVRAKANDWDFSLDGRKRQSARMKNLSNSFIKKNKNVVVDFICPTEETRNEFNPDILIWIDTIKFGRFEDTNKMFTAPKKYDFRIKKKDAINLAPGVAINIKKKWKI